MSTDLPYQTSFAQNIIMSGPAQASYPDDLKAIDQALSRKHLEYVNEGESWSLEKNMMALQELKRTAEAANKHADARDGHPRKMCEIVYENLIVAFQRFQYAKADPQADLRPSLVNLVRSLAHEVEQRPMTEWGPELFQAVKPYKQFEREHWNTQVEDWRWQQGLGGEIGDDDKAWPKRKIVRELNKAFKDITRMMSNFQAQ